ncbi:MAG: lysozyme [Proteobacteria bacterium]|nr:lysozyme [Pseudomonadota bacterium]
MTDQTPAPAGAPKRLAGGLAALLLAAVGVATPLTMRSEGLRLRAYRDPVGIVTECMGHTGDDVKITNVRTPDQCRSELAQDELKAARAIAPCIRVEVPLKTRAAFIDFAFNVGAGAFCRSEIPKRLDAHNLPAACAELSRWVYASGQVLPGLVKRRAAERALCEAGVAGK